MINNTITKIKKTTSDLLLQKWKLALIVPVYFLIYIPWFRYIERINTATSRYHIIHMKLDDYVPFCEYFVIPYFLWFAYIAVVVIATFFTDDREYLRCCTFLFVGMTIFLIISTLYPNGQLLRPHVFENQNLFTYLTGYLYSIDTPTNLFPSIHVFNSIGVHITVRRNKVLREIKWIQITSFIICVSIILSTVFLKQHSMFDLITAFIMAIVLYPLVYLVDYSHVRQQRKVPQE